MIDTVTGSLAADATNWFLFSDALYFEELSVERVLDIYQHESAYGIIVSMGGQTPNNISCELHSAGARILGTNTAFIQIAEDRQKFSNLLDSLQVCDLRTAR